MDRPAVIEPGQHAVLCITCLRQGGDDTYLHRVTRDFWGVAMLIGHLVILILLAAHGAGTVRRFMHGACRVLDRIIVAIKIYAESGSFRIWQYCVLSVHVASPGHRCRR